MENSSGPFDPEVRLRLRAMDGPCNASFLEADVAACKWAAGEIDRLRKVEREAYLFKDALRALSAKVQAMK